MTVSGLVLKKFGSARSMLLVPSLFTLFFLCIFLSVLIGTTASIVFSCIVIAGMGLRIAFFDSFFSPNFQIFFSSLPQQIRGRGKLTMEGVIKPCAMVLSGIWLMWAGKQLSLTIQAAILFIVALIAIFQTWRIKNQYAKSLTNYLTGFSGVKSSGLGIPNFNSSPEVLRRLSGKLYLEEDFEVKKFIIELIATSTLSEATRILIDFFKQSDSRTRSFMLASIHGTNQKGLKDLVETALSDPDARVVANAVLALAEISGRSLLHHVDMLLKHPSPRVRANLIYSAWRFSDEGTKKVLLGRTYKILYEKFPEESSSALYALGGMDDDAPTQLLWEFVKFFKKNLHEYPSVFNQAVRALGKKRTIISADLLLQLSVGCTRKQRNEIVKALGSVMTNLTYEHLCALSFATDYSVFNLIVAANHVTGNVVDDAWYKHLINYAEREIQETITYTNKYRNLDYLHGKGAELLRFAILEEHIDVRIDTLVQIASLVDRSGHIRKIIPRLFHSNAHMRARAFEVLDNSGDSKLNRSIMNILENRMNINKDKSDIKNLTGSEEHSLTEFLADPNEWVAQCAQFCVISQVRSTI
jgi:HEAT repeat protein